MKSTKFQKKNKTILSSLLKDHNTLWKMRKKNTVRAKTVLESLKSLKKKNQFMRPEAVINKNKISCNLPQMPFKSIRISICKDTWTIKEDELEEGSFIKMPLNLNVKK